MQGSVRGRSAGEVVVVAAIDGPLLKEVIVARADEQGPVVAFVHDPLGDEAAVVEGYIKHNEERSLVQATGGGSRPENLPGP